jgi:hypothetical protein
MQLKANILYNWIYVMTNYLYKSMFYRLYSMSMWEYFYSAGVAGILRESRPALKIFNPTPSRSRGIPAGPTGLPQCGTPFWGSTWAPVNPCWASCIILMCAGESWRCMQVMLQVA